MNSSERNPVAAFGRALSAELLKTRRTLALLMTLIAPAIIAVIQFAMYIENHDYYVKQVDQNQWLTLGQNSMVFWSLLMLPLFVTLETALLSGLEYGRKNWTLLYTMPVPRWAFYAAKEVISLALIGASTMVMFGLVLADGLILQAIEPAYGLSADLIPWRQIGTGYALLYLAAFLIISIHLWVSSRWPNFVVAIGVGIAATVTAMLIFQSDYARFFPWTMPGLLALTTMKKVELFMPVPLYLAIGLGGGLLFALLGGWNITRRDVL
jgi:hypothetical protein